MILHRNLFAMMLIFGLLMTCSCGKSRIDSGDTRKENGILYEIGKQKPYTGIVIKKNTEGIVIEAFAYKDGILNGSSKEYWDNGNLKSETDYKDGIWNGSRKRYWDNGKLKSEGHYTNSILEGLFKTYRVDGKKESISYCENGEYMTSIAQKAIQERKYEEGIRIYKDAINKGSTRALNGLAWFLATGPEQFQNGPEALTFARQADKATPDTPSIIDTLAAAYAKTGQLDLAISTQQRAIRLLEDGSDLSKGFNERLAFYVCQDFAGQR